MGRRLQKGDVRVRRWQDVWDGSWRFRGFEEAPVKRIATPGRMCVAINLKSFAMYAAEEELEEELKGVNELR